MELNIFFALNHSRTFIVPIFSSSNHDWKELMPGNDVTKKQVA